MDRVAYSEPKLVLDRSLTDSAIMSESVILWYLAIDKKLKFSDINVSGKAARKWALVWHSTSATRY